MKKENIDIKKLKEALHIAEANLKETENKNSMRAKYKSKKINKALEKAYATLNLGDYTQKEIDKRTDKVWESLLEENTVIAVLIFFFGIALSGTLVFATYQAYSFFQSTLDAKHHLSKELEDKINSLVKVNYMEQNTVSLYDDVKLKDSDGLTTSPKELSITNSSKEVPGFNYHVNYYISLIPMNDPEANTIDKEHIKYSYSYKDTKTGKYFESEIGTLNDLKIQKDGSLLLTTGTQKLDSKTDFKIKFWVSINAPSETENKTYTFQFKVDSDVEEVK